MQSCNPAYHAAALLAAPRLTMFASLTCHYIATGACFSIVYLLSYWSPVCNMPVNFVHGLHLGELPVKA
jgi:hypothetical protein